MDQINFCYIKMITCNFNRNSCHILKRSKILPCGNTACYDCIKSNLRINNQLSCPFEKCKQVHEIINPDCLVENALIEQAIEDNLLFLNKILTKELEEKLTELTKIYNDNRVNMIKEFDLTENEIKCRIEFLISELRNIENNLLESLRMTKDAVLTNYEKKFELITFQAYKNNEQNIKPFNDDTSLKTIQMNNIEVMKNSMYRYQDCLYHLSSLGENLKENINNVKFVPSVWLPTVSMLGDLVNGDEKVIANDINMNNILHVTSNANAVHLSCGIKKISKMCNLNDKFLVLLSNQDLKNELTLIDENFVFKKSLSSIGSRRFKQLAALCTDNTENIYLADSGQSQILILDLEFSVIKRLIGKKGTRNGEFNGLVDICFFDGRLYVLDKCKRVQVFSKQGEFIRVVKLFRNNSTECDEFEPTNDAPKAKRRNNTDSNVNDNISAEKFLEHPISLKGFNNTIAILDNNKCIYIYNMDGYLKQIINAENKKQINTFSLNENFLFILYEPSIFTCWVHNPEANLYSMTMQTSINTSNDVYSDMCCYKGKWVFSSCFSGRLTMLLK